MRSAGQASLFKFRLAIMTDEDSDKVRLGKGRLATDVNQSRVPSHFFSRSTIT